MYKFKPTPSFLRRVRPLQRHFISTDTTKTNIKSVHRSLLYIPASKTRAVEKAHTLPTDAIIFDLEDAVSPDQKPSAREYLKKILSHVSFKPRTILVRINGLDTPWGKDDILSFSDEETAAAVDGIVIPKVKTPDDIIDVDNTLVGEKSLWAMMETTDGILNAASIASHPSLKGFIMGTEDLAAELNCSSSAASSRDGLTTSLQMCLLAAKSRGKICIDGVYPAFRDEDGLKKECWKGREWGFDGKSLVHPRQVDVTNDVFKPTMDEVTLAGRYVDAFEKARRDGVGVAVVDGRLVEGLHVERALRVLEMVEAIEKLEKALR